MSAQASRINKGNGRNSAHHTLWDTFSSGHAPTATSPGGYAGRRGGGRCGAGLRDRIQVLTQLVPLPQWPFPVLMPLPAMDRLLSSADWILPYLQLSAASAHRCLGRGGGLPGDASHEVHCQAERQGIRQLAWVGSAASSGGMRWLLPFRILGLPK